MQILTHLSSKLVSSVLQSIPVVPKVAEGHDEAANDALNCGWHGMIVSRKRLQMERTFKGKFKFSCTKISILSYLEDDVVGLREPHDEDEKDGAEPDQVVGNHPVNHAHEGTGQLETPAKQQCQFHVKTININIQIFFKKKLIEISFILSFLRFVL